MQAFLQSAFLQALSQSLIASIWQMALLWLAAIMLLKLFKFSPSQKFNIAFIAQLSGLALFITTGINAYSNANTVAAINITAANNVLVKLNGWLIAGMPYLTTAYLGVLVYKLCRLAVCYNASKGLRKHQLKKIEATHRIFVQQMCELFSLKRKVKIFLSEKIACPLTMGFFKPIILIPVAAINHLTTEQMEAVILHELAHIKRADYLLFILQNVIDKIFFFNIFSIMLSNIIELERENACDDWVLQFKYNSMHYAEALFKLGRLKALPVPVMSFGGKKDSLLLIRVKRLLHNQSKPAYNFQPALIGLFSLLIATGMIISATVKPLPKNDSVNQIVTGEASKIIEPVAFKQKILPVNVNASSKNKSNKSSIKKEVANQIAITFNDQQQKLHDLQQQLINNQIKQALKQNYLVRVSQSLDSLKTILPQYQQAINTQISVTPELAQKAMSYQNFKTLEAMLAASGDSISVTETDASKNSYQKEITIESFDKKGNKHVYTVIAQLYQ
ncbi:MAG: M56 family metallopeptidase [Parafilimonas sp.]|nr:M56 family metallopeptidase [Parafilimonas sp.]